MTSATACQVEICPGGAPLVRGAAQVIDPKGDRPPTTPPVVAVCLCGRSRRAPWCDGTHKVVTRTAPPPKEAGAS